ncbi:MAG: Crp/Fnr family transcriptional regulator [Saprospiraceae bacterium]|nr:Crp/Fnr family transcriptional regulator [Saprospiraceae bacterium]
MKEYILNLFPELAVENELLESIVRTATLKKVSKGEILIDYGSFIQFVPLVVKGLIKIIRENEEGKELLLYFLSEGNTCAASFSCCMIRKRSEIKAIAEEDSIIIAIPLLSAEEWMGKFTTWRNFVMNVYDQRIFAMIDTIDKLAFAKLDEKLWDYLEERVFITGNVLSNLSHQEIANDLNVSREAVSRLLKKLEQQGKVEIHRSKIVVKED